MTDRTTLTNREIKMMWSKCDLDGDGYLDFEEFKEMIMRSRERKELARLKEEAEMTVSDEELDTITQEMINDFRAEVSTFKNHTAMSHDNTKPHIIA